MVDSNVREHGSGRDVRRCVPPRGPAPFRPFPPAPAPAIAPNAPRAYEHFGARGEPAPPKCSGALVVFGRAPSGELKVLLIQPRLTYAFRELVLGWWYPDEKKRSALARGVTPNEALVLLSGNYNMAHYLFAMRYVPSPPSTRTLVRKRRYEESVAQESVRVELREGGFGKLWWMVPRGRPAPGETSFDTACREFEEESGVSARAVRWVPHCTHVDDYVSMGARYRITYHCAVLKGALPNISVKTVAQMREVADIGWFSMDELRRHIEPRQHGIVTKFKRYVKKHRLET